MPLQVYTNQVEPSGLFVEWTDVSNNEDGFEIRDCLQVACSVDVTVGANVDIVYLTSIPSGTYKCFTVRAFNSFGASDWSPYTCARA
jgi:hypothetical protein